MYTLQIINKHKFRTGIHQKWHQDFSHQSHWLYYLENKNYLPIKYHKVWNRFLNLSIVLPPNRTFQHCPKLSYNFRQVNLRYLSTDISHRNLINCDKWKVIAWVCTCSVTALLHNKIWFLTVSDLRIKDLLVLI